GVGRSARHANRTGAPALGRTRRRTPWVPLPATHGSASIRGANGPMGLRHLRSGFPDLNLRLAELLADMQMPAALLGPVLASATLDFINSAPSRDEDDRRGLVEFVQALGPERLEQYLALLTTDGPLVPVRETMGRTAHPGVSRGWRLLKMPLSMPNAQCP